MPSAHEQDGHLQRSDQVQQLLDADVPTSDSSDSLMGLVPVRIAPHEFQYVYRPSRERTSSVISPEVRSLGKMSDHRVFEHCVEVLRTLPGGGDDQRRL